VAFPTSSNEPAPVTTCNEILSRMHGLISRSDALGDRIGCVSNRLVGSRPEAAALSTQKPMEVPNGFFEELQLTIDQITMSLTSAESQVSRLDGSGAV
jgi:hypothetical protein